MPQFDERDTIFAREDLVAGSSDYDNYYADNPGMQGMDDYIRSLPGLGAHAPQVDTAYMESIRWLLWHIGQPEMVDGDPEDEKVKLSPERASIKVKKYAEWLGTDLVGISKVNQEYVYSHRGRSHYPEEPVGSPITLTHKFAVSLGFRENIEMVRTGPHHGEMLESMTVYQKSAVVSVLLAKYIRLLGYPARAHHFRNYQVQSVPLAVDAGLGELARCGFLLTKQFGNCLRLSTVTTDLPLDMDLPIDIGVQDFCSRCKLCADSCPSRAIPFGDKIDVRGNMKWKLATLKCIAYWNKVGSDCGICIASCPWSQPDVWYHRIGTEVATKSEIGRIVLLWLYPIIYGKHKAKPNPDWLGK